MGGPKIRPPGVGVTWDDAQPRRSITSPCTDVARYSDARDRWHIHRAWGTAQFRVGDELVKNADENWPTAPQLFPEVTGVRWERNRDDSCVSPTGYTLAECTGNG
ncbi:hypothetical protein GCM10010276_13860 [Streptomyces longisporus]|uniref:Uncharacterized protein n=1 Tax=Streptomyces longisporus TaxID=1948 RepID=A0ABP5YFH1_STRLO